MAFRNDVLLPEIDRGQFRTSPLVSWIVVAYWILTLVLT
jgi:hypothetical protein